MFRCKYCGDETTNNNEWCGSQSCLMQTYRAVLRGNLNYKETVEQARETYSLMGGVSRLMMSLLYKKKKPILSVPKKRKFKMMYGGEEYIRKSWIHDLSTGDRTYLRGKGIKDQDWEKMSAIDQCEWKEECKDARYYKNDNEIKQLTKRT